VVDLADQAHPSVLQARDEEDPPHRPVAIERRREHLVAQGGERRVADRLVRLRERLDVLGQIEAGVLDPAGLGEAERRRLQSPAAPGDAVEPLRDPLAQRGQRRASAAVRDGEDGAPADVHVRGGALEAQERAVEGGQPAHARGLRQTGVTWVALGPFGPDSAT
jgi:hypothetical protein